MNVQPWLTADVIGTWVGVFLTFCVLSFLSYVALFRGVIGEQTLHLEWRESYQITMAGLAATRLFSAGGAGGIVLTYWALRKAGMERRQVACRTSSCYQRCSASWVAQRSLIVLGQRSSVWRCSFSHCCSSTSLDHQGSASGP